MLDRALVLILKNLGRIQIKGRALGPMQEEDLICVPRRLGEDLQKLGWGMVLNPINPGKVIVGRVIQRFGPNLNTDEIIPAKHKFTQDLSQLAQHAFEPIDPDFPRKARSTQNPIILGDRNFGCGSSREHAVLVLKQLGIKAIIAKSFARIFYRNCFNLGLPALICSQVDSIPLGALIRIDLESNIITDQDSGQQYSIQPLSSILAQILEHGGLMEYLRARGGFELHQS